MTAPFDLQRFVDAQNAHGTYEQALKEIRNGRKTNHWMWFVFPQIAGLRRSPVAQRYALSGLPEARAYLEHPLLGARLEECVQALLTLPHPDAQRIFGDIDALKLRSSMTVFAQAAPEKPVFAEVIGRYFDGQEDEATLAVLRRT